MLKKTRKMSKTHTLIKNLNTKMRLKKEVGRNTEITIATDDGVYHLTPNRIDFNNP